MFKRECECFPGFRLELKMQSCRGSSCDGEPAFHAASALQPATRSLHRGEAAGVSRPATGVLTFVDL